jgi:putative hydrolase of HD superfamily
VYEKLYAIPRTGWVKRGVKNPENVGQHTDSLIKLVDQWGKDLKIQNIEKTKDMLKIHDFPEILEGDPVIAHLPDEEYLNAKSEKYKKEYLAMKTICQPLGEMGKTAFAYWLEFEENKSHDTQIAHELDKTQAVIKAFEYQQSGENVSTQEFIDEIEKRKQVKNDFLVSVIKEIQNKL